MMLGELHVSTHRLMPSNRGLLLLSILALSGCDGGSHSEHAPETQADPVDAGTRIVFSGQVLLDAALKDERQGSIVISVGYVGEQRALLQRFYELGDPWRTGDTLQFGLSAQDHVLDTLPTFARYMSLVVRFDVDGNPATNDPLDVEVTTTVKTGASDIAVLLHRSETVASRSARVGSK